MAKITASANGENRYLATPERKKIGTKTMQIHMVDTRAGTAICAAPSRIASKVGLPSARCRSIFSMVTVASSTRMPTAKASPPNVMVLSVCRRALSAAMEESGQRNRDRNDQGALPIAQKQKDHDRRQTRRDHRFAHDAVNGPGDEDRLVCQR